jgi:hypothetical protein
VCVPVKLFLYRVTALWYLEISPFHTLVKSYCSLILEVSLFHTLIQSYCSLILEISTFHTLIQSYCSLILEISPFHTLIQSYCTLILEVSPFHTLIQSYCSLILEISPFHHTLLVSEMIISSIKVLVYEMVIFKVSKCSNSVKKSLLNNEISIGLVYSSKNQVLLSKL